MQNRRKHERKSSEHKVRITWVDDSGRYYHEISPVVDTSENGLALLLQNRLKPESYIGLHLAPDGFTRRAQLRNVTQKGTRYRIGLELPVEKPKK